MPTSIEPLATNGMADTRVYRLSFFDGSTVIAKRCARDTGLVECAVYEKVLANLPIPSPRFYGSIGEESYEHENQLWIFIEDLNRTCYDPRSREHRAAGARWLARFHHGVLELDVKSHLPHRGPDHYLELLTTAATKIGAQESAVALTVIERETLEQGTALCARLVANWRNVHEACEGLEYTVVHGDFIAKNVFVRKVNNQIEALPIDWEKACWGISAEDLSTVDLAEYLHCSRSRAPDLTIEHLKRAALVGKVFRSIVFINWATSDPADNPARTADNLVLSNSWLEGLLPRLLD